MRPAKQPGRRSGSTSGCTGSAPIGESRAGWGILTATGELDVVAGPYIYFAPEWRPLQFREVKGDVDERGIGYRDDFMNLPLDVDGDGWLDVVSCCWFDKSRFGSVIPAPAKKCGSRS